MVKENNDMSQHIQNLLAENALLRQLSKVPDNFGDQLEDYKKKLKDNAVFQKHSIDVLMKDIETLEKEKALLHHELRKWRIANPGVISFMDGLDEDQKQAVHNWIINLRNGKQEIPLTEKSENLKAEVMRLQDRMAVYEEVIAKGRGGEGIQASHIDNSQLQAILDAIKNQGRQMESIVGNNRYVPDKENSNLDPSYQQLLTNINKPPKPTQGIFGDWAEVNEGVSYKFNSKLNLKSYDEELSNMDMDKAKYFIACLQLHNMESIELLHQREQEFSLLTQELNDVRAHLRDALLVQDELFTKHHFELSNFESKVAGLKKENYDLKTECIQAVKKCEIFDSSLGVIQSKNPLMIESRLAEMTKIAALAETNIIKLSRKYDALETEHDQFLSTFNVAEKDRKAREYEMEESLNALQKWRTDATEKIKVLLERVSNSVPIEEHSAIKADFEMERQKYAALKANENIIREQNIRLQGAEREKHEQLENVHKLEDEISAIEAEYAILHMRLCALDKTYERHTLVFKNIANILKQKNISPVQYFQAIDTNKDGGISAEEFGRALFSMGIQMGEGELEEMYSFLDIDSSGSIDYKEFCRKLKRYGVVLRSAEEELVNNMWNSITRVYMTLEEAYRAFDHKNMNELTFSEMILAFKELGIEVDSKTASNFFKLADVTGNGKISCAEFVHVFSRFNKRDRALLTADTHQNWKIELMAKLEQLTREKGVSLEEIFKDIDEDGDSRVSFDEFRRLFLKMGLNIEKKSLLQMFNEIDNNKSGVMTYTEFLSYVNFAKKESERIKRITAYQKSSQNKGFGESMILDGDFTAYSDPTTKYQLKIAQLESRQSNYSRQNAEYIKKINNYEDEQVTLRANIKSLEDTLLNTQQQLITEKERSAILQRQTQSVITKDQATAIRAANENLRIESTQLRSALDTFRNLHEAAVREVKSLRLAIGKNDDEVIHLRREIRELQSVSDENALIGKLFNQILTEKWTEASFNRKYDQLIDDYRKSQIKAQNWEKKVQDKEDEIMNLHSTKDEVERNLNKQLFEARMSILPTVTLTKLEELNLALKRIGNQKLELEVTNKQLRLEAHENQVRLDSYILREKNLQELEDTLKVKNNDELSLKIIELSEKLSTYKLGELKAQREVSLIREREEYFMRVNKNQTDQILSLEEMVAKCDEKMVLREKMWREKYQELLKVIPKMQEQKKPLSATLSSGEIHAIMRDGVHSLGDKEKEVMMSPSPTKRSGIGFGNLSQSALDDNQILRDKIQLLQDDIRLREIKIDKLEKELATKQTGVNYRTDNIETLAISDLEAKTRDITLAAQQTVQTLQLMIDDKTKLLNDKEKKIDELRNDLTEKAKSMSRIELENENLRRQIATGDRNKMNIEQFTALKTIEKLSNLDQKEMERIVITYEQKLQMMAEYVSQVEKDNRELAKKASSSRTQRDLLENAKSTDANLKELEKLKKDLSDMTELYKKKALEVKRLNKVLSDYAQDLDKMKDEVTKTKVEESQKLMVARNDTGHYEEKIAQFQAKFKALQEDFAKEKKQVTELKSNEIRYRQQVTELTQQVTRLSALNLQPKEDFSKTGTSGLSKKPGQQTNLPTVAQRRPSSSLKNQSPGMMKNTDYEELEQLRAENGRLKLDLKQLKESNPGSSPTNTIFTQEISKLKAENERLNTAAAALRDQLSTNESNAEFIDTEGYLYQKDAMSFTDLDSFIAVLRRYLNTVGKGINLYEVMKKADPFNTGVAPPNVILEQLAKVGIKLKNRDQSFIAEFVPKNAQGQMKYQEFYYMLKGNIADKSTEIVALPGTYPVHIGADRNTQSSTSKPTSPFNQAGTSKASPGFNQGPKPVQKVPENSYHTAVLDKNVDLLKKKLIEKDKELDDLNKQLKSWKQTALQYENDLKEKGNSSRYANMSINATLEAKIGRKGENLKQIQDLEDQVRTLKSEMQYEIEKREQIIKELQEDVTKKTYEQTMAQSEAQNLRTQLDRVLSSRLQKDHLWEEREKEKDVLVSSLMDRLDKSRKQEEEIKLKMRTIERENIDLKHIKEGITTRLENMNREIRELKEKKKFE